jgi:hypothetical protein
MPMPFNEFEFEWRNHFKQRSRQLTQASSYRRNHATFTNFAPQNITARFPRRTDVPPKTKYLTRKQHPVVKLFARELQILDLSKLKWQFTRIDRRNERGA